MSKTHLTAACMLASVFAIFSGCTSTQVHTVSELRAPAQESPDNANTYKLPITRNGQTATRVAFRYWSGEWPSPVIDVKSNRSSGSTAIRAYSSLRDPAKSQQLTCTIRNGVYHPWAGRGVSETNNRRLDPSAITYYTILAAEDYEVVNATSIENGEGTAPTALPRGARIENVVYYGENFCGATLVHNGSSTPVESDCPFFQENTDLRRIGTPDSFEAEQWIHVTCNEKDSTGQSIKAFVKDSDLLAQPGIRQACHGGYGFVRRHRDCAN